MAVRSFLIPLVFLGGLSVAAAAQESPEKPGPQPLLPAPRYVGPMGKGAQIFTAPPAPRPSIVALGRQMRTVPPSRNSVCYAIRTYAFTIVPGENDVIRPAGSSTCESAGNSHMKAARQIPESPQ